MTVMRLQRSTTLQLKRNQKNVIKRNDELPFFIILDLQKNTQVDYMTSEYESLNNNINKIIEENKHRYLTTTKRVFSQVFKFSSENFQKKKTIDQRSHKRGGIAMRYYRLWIYACNIVILLSAISYSTALCYTFFLSSDLRRHLVPGLPNLYDPTALYTYLALTVQFGLVQLLGCIAARKLDAKLLNAYWLLILGLFCGDITIGIIWIFRLEKIRADLRPILKTRLQVEYNRTFKFSEQWNLLQSKFLCCGVTGPFDFGFQWPQSCCSPEITSTSNSEINQNNTLSNGNSSDLDFLEPCLGPYNKGCEDQLLLWLRKTADLLFILSFCVIAFTKLCFIGILRYEIREMIKKIQIMKEPILPNTAFSQPFYPSQSSHYLHQQQKQQLEISVTNEDMSEKRNIPFVTTNTASDATSLLVQNCNLTNIKHPLVSNNIQDCGLDSDTNSHCALILEESTPPTSHHSTINSRKKSNGNNNYELKEFNRRLPVLDNNDKFVSESLDNTSSVAIKNIFAT